MDNAVEMSDSSSLSDFADDATSTNVLLGYSSLEPTDDAFSQLGGEPTWLDATQQPAIELAQCKVCHGYMALLLQLNGDLPDKFPGHERRLYLWTCRRRACRRKPGSVRATRAVRVSRQAPAKEIDHEKATNNATKSPTVDLGASLFGSDSVKARQETQNPFSGSAKTSPFTSNPFSSTSSTLQSQDINKLSETFAQKARVSNQANKAATHPPTTTKPSVPWPDSASLAKPFPKYWLDAEYEYISAIPPSSSGPSAQTQGFMDLDQDRSSAEGAGTKETLYESDHDKAFQYFADTLSHNPEQVLRYEFKGTPLLYSKTDPVGKSFPSASSHPGQTHINSLSISSGNNMPPCSRCGSPRVFELQLTPHAITELEAEEDAATLLGDGMEWGTIILGVCSQDCASAVGNAEKVEYFDEWVGVQWEELVSRSPASGAGASNNANAAASGNEKVKGKGRK